MRADGSLETLVVVPESDRAGAARWGDLTLPFIEVVIAVGAGEAVAQLSAGTADAVLLDATAAIGDTAVLLDRLAGIAQDRPFVVVVPADADSALAPLTALAGRVDFRLVADGGPIELCRAIRKVVSECRRVEQRRSHDRIDPLTGLANRDAFRDGVGALLGARDGASMVAMLDLDGLAAVNALVGRDLADRVLGLVAQRLTATLLDGDQLAAVGGGRYLLWTPLPTMAEEGLLRVRRVLQAIARPFNLAGERLQLTASAGVALHPADGSDIDTLIARAEAAMYRAKAQAPNSYRLHQPRSVGAAPAQLRTRAVLRRELEREGLELLFEPQLDLRSDRPRAARLHVRTRADGAVMRLSGDEIEDLALPVFRWMLDAAGRQMSTWLAQEVPLVPLVVDLPHELVRRNDAVEMIRRRLQSAGCHPAWFEVAVPGWVSGVEAGDGVVADNLQALRDLGLRVTLVGYGSARASLAALRALPADGLELAPDLVRGHRERSSDAAILRSLVSLGVALGLDVGAAGVDRPGLARQLRELGCDWTSGAWVGAPMPASAFSDWLSGGGTLMIAAS